MNKPIRTISIFCLLLFVALMVNATYLQYWKSGKLDDDPRNRRELVASYSRERGAILVGRNNAVAKSVESDDEYKYQRTYPKPMEYAPITGWFSYYSSTGIERTQNDILSGDDSRLFVTKLVDLLSNNPPQGGNVLLTIDPKAQDAAYQGLKGLGANVQGAVVALEPSTGKVLAMVSLPTYDPNRLASHDLAQVTKDFKSLNNDPTEPLLNRAIQTRLPPGSSTSVATASAWFRFTFVTRARTRSPGRPRRTKTTKPSSRATPETPYASESMRSSSSSFLATLAAKPLWATNRLKFVFVPSGAIGLRGQAAPPARQAMGQRCAGDRAENRYGARLVSAGG